MTLEQKRQRNEMIPLVLSGPTHFAQFLVTAVVQCGETVKSGFIDNKQNRKIQYLGTRKREKTQTGFSKDENGHKSDEEESHDINVIPFMIYLLMT